MLVTTSYDPTAEQTAEAREAARKLGADYVVRGRLSLSRLLTKSVDCSLLLVSRERMEYHQEERSPMFFHPSMAMVRVKRLMAGEPDALIQASGVKPGDNVLDCTAGLASDSIVLSYAVGPEGTVTAVESEPIIHFLVSEGLKTYESGVDNLDRAMRRIRLLQGDHADYLRETADRSVDIVYLDPMFRRTIELSSSIAPIRNMANGSAVSKETIEHAKRVARKAVVLKEHWKSGEFERLGFRETIRSAAKLAYGVIRL